MASKIRKNYVLVDLENIQPTGLMELDPAQFVVHVFIGSRQTKVPYELAEALQKMGSDSTYVRIAGHGKNALDFHIAYYLGKLHQQDSDGYFHILSKDKGFDPLIEHLRDNKILASRIESILEISLVRARRATTPEAKLEIVLERLNQMKAAKPRRLKTLESTIVSLFQKTLTESELSAILLELQQKGYVQNCENRITYKLPDDA